MLFRSRPDFTHPATIQSFASIENAKLSEGSLIPIDPAKLARVTIQLKSPYIMTQGKGTADGIDSCEVSLDHGKTWKRAELKDFGAVIGGQVQALIRLTLQKSIRQLELQATVQNNPFALPYLSPGKNTIAVFHTAGDPPSRGSTILVNIGCTANNRNALRNSVPAYAGMRRTAGRCAAEEWAVMRVL